MEAGTGQAGKPGFGGDSSLSEEARKAAEGVADTVRHEASDLVSRLKEQARGMVEEQKSAAAEQIHGVAEALRKASEELEAHHNRPMADAVRRSAESVEDVAECVRSESIGDLYRYAEDFSRRHPAMVVGGAALAAFLFARFLRASGEASRYDDDYLEFEENRDEVGRTR